MEAIESPALGIGQAAHYNPCCRATRYGDHFFAAYVLKALKEAVHPAQVCIIDAVATLFVWVGPDAFDEDEGLAMQLAHGCIADASSYAQHTDSYITFLLACRYGELSEPTLLVRYCFLNIQRNHGIV
jgi:hypothetical protein